MKEIDSITRRKFIGSSALAGAAASFPYVARGENLQSDTIRVAVVGMGGRGTASALLMPRRFERQNIRCNTKLVAVADAFPEKSANKIAAFKKKHGEDRVDVEGRIFGGLDGYKQPSMKMWIWW